MGITKKGKDFFKLQTPLSEEINNIVVYETKIYTGCESVYNLYDDGNEAAYYINRDVINDLIIENVTKENDFDVILACQDNCLRIIQGSQCICEIVTSSPVTCVTSIPPYDKNSSKRGPVHLIYGMESGSIAEVRLNVQDGNVTATHSWLVEDSASRSPVSCLKVFELLKKNGLGELIIGRDDGRLQVFARDSDGNTPKLIFSHDIGKRVKHIVHHVPYGLSKMLFIEESIRGIECGLVNSTEFNEVIVMLLR